MDQRTRIIASTAMCLGLIFSIGCSTTNTALNVPPSDDYVIPPDEPRYTQPPESGYRSPPPKKIWGSQPASGGMGGATMSGM